MSASKTIVRNALFSYGRTLIAAGLTLFSSRWILADLGASDYGVYGLVGVLLVFVTYVSSVLGQATGRYLAFAIGEGEGNVIKWFNASANIYFCLPIILAPIAIVVGEVCVRCFLKIPPDRLNAALWILRFSLVSVCGVLVSMPYQSLLTAKQYIHISAMIMLWHSVAMFLIALLLPVLPGDHLIWYAALVAIGMVSMQAIYVIVCHRLCPESRVDFGLWWDWPRIKELCKYSSWLFVGAIGMLFRTQGISVLVNRMKGATANAGQSIGTQLSNQTETLYNAFVMALNPEITRREGAGSHENMLVLAKRSTKLGFMIIFMVALPLFCECEYVLKLWLVNPPPYAVFFTRVQILLAIICKARIGHMMCFHAVGEVKRPQIVDACFYIASVFVICLVYYITASIETAFIVSIGFHFLYMLAYIYVGSKTFEWPLLDMVKTIIVPGCVMFVGGVAIFHGISYCTAGMGFLRLMATTGVLIPVVVAFFFMFVFDTTDRGVVVECCKKVIRRISKGKVGMVQ